MSTRSLLSAGDGLAFRSEPVRCGGDRFLRRLRRPGMRSGELYGEGECLMVLKVSDTRSRT